MLNKKILIIDDDVNLCQSVQMLCSMEGADVEFATDGRKGLQRFYDSRPDLVLLDIRMPDIDGWETCRHVRMVSDTPIIMLTTLDQDRQIVRGFDDGADDYVTKPFSNEVLKARINAQLRRKSQPAHQEAPSAPHDNLYDDGYLTVDLDNHMVLINGESIRITVTEFDLLSYFVKRRGKLLKYETILSHVWGVGDIRNKDYVHIYLNHLRKKIEVNPKLPQYLVTEYGVGVRFIPQDKQG